MRFLWKKLCDGIGDSRGTQRQHPYVIWLLSLLLRGKIMSSLILRSGRVTTLLRTWRLSMQHDHHHDRQRNETTNSNRFFYFVFSSSAFFLSWCQIQGCTPYRTWRLDGAVIRLPYRHRGHLSSHPSWRSTVRITTASGKWQKYLVMLKRA